MWILSVNPQDFMKQLKMENPNDCPKFPSEDWQNWDALEAR